MTRRESCASMEQSINISPLKLTRKRSAELGIPRTTMWSSMKKYQKVKAWQPSFVNELSDTDKENRKIASAELPQVFNRIPA